MAPFVAARAAHGDTFTVRSGGSNYLFTFSPRGVESFYALPEETASKGVADFLMLRRKLPEEIFDGRRILPAALFRRDDVASYLTNLGRALDHTVDELGPQGSTDVFTITRRLGHRMGLMSWAPPGAGDGAAFESLVGAFDTLDGSDAFVHPDAMAAVAAPASVRRRPASPMLVTAFGHGRHSCPAQPFSLAAMTTAMTRLLRDYHLTPGWTDHPRPVPAQIGGVARAAGPCRLDYRTSETYGQVSVNG